MALMALTWMVTSSTVMMRCAIDQVAMPAPPNTALPPHLGRHILDLLSCSTTMAKGQPRGLSGHTLLSLHPRLLNQATS